MTAIILFFLTIKQNLANLEINLCNKKNFIPQIFLKVAANCLNSKDYFWAKMRGTLSF